MTPQQFDICLRFHNELIRASIDDFIVLGAKTILTGKDYTPMHKYVNERGRVINLVEKLKARFDALVKWDKAQTVKQFIDIYNKSNKKRNPSREVFFATFSYMAGTVMNKAATEHGVNPQCLKALKPRIERWEKYSHELYETL